VNSGEFEARKEPQALCADPHSFAPPRCCMLVRNQSYGLEIMTTGEKGIATRSYFGERDVAKRVYDALVSGGVNHQREKALCRELAALAGNMYQRQNLSDADVDEMLLAAARD